MDKLLVIINEMLTNLGVEAIGSLNKNDKLKDDLEIDSISYAELVVNIENEFNININQEGRAETIGDIVERLSL